MLDIVELKVKSGDGGRGAVTFRHEKYIPFGGPFGGDGGMGGDVLIRAEEGLSTLRAYQRRRSFKAENGQPGMTKNKHGRDGLDLILTVPPGTRVYRKIQSDKELLADLEEDGQEVVAARGGQGGFGNTHYATSTNQAPRIAQPGIPGHENIIILELRLIAEVGIIGYPNVGKSSLLAALSAAKPKIADYPFTTLEPILGRVKVNDDGFVLAEIPGLIEGAHAGKGLGHEFLRHAMRTRVLVHLIDGTAESPLDNMINVNNELALFDVSLAKRPQVVAINKIDLPEVKERQNEIKIAFKEAGITPVFVSAASKIGLDKLVEETWNLLKAADIRAKVITQTAPVVLHPQPVDGGPRAQKTGKTYIVTDIELEYLLDKTDLDDPAERQEFNEKLERMGINKQLHSAGAKSGDTVITGNREWKWYYTDEHRHSGRNV
jgi:GTP-binding protein